MPMRFQRDLEKLTGRLLAMGAKAEQMVRDVLTVVAERDRELKRRIKRAEASMDRYQSKIDDEMIRMISVHTPVASNLRLLLMVTRINAELERIGDQVINIGFYAKALLKAKTSPDLFQIPEMATMAADMLHGALEAFQERSSDKAMAIIELDDQVDQMNDEMYRKLLTAGLSEPEAVAPAISLILTARAFERIADHAVNIAEDVIYIVEGEDIRHGEVSS
jgi:phosphate transport system protein